MHSSASTPADEPLLNNAALLQHASDAIISTDLNFVITSWNHAAETLYGWSAAEAIGQPAAALLQTDYADQPAEHIRQQFSIHGIWRGEVSQRHKDGSLIAVSASISLLKDRTNTAIGIVAVNRDITEQIRAETTLRELAENMATAQRIAHFGSWEIALTPELEFIEPVLWSDECYRIFGFAPGSVEVTHAFFQSRIHPDDRGSGLRALSNAYQHNIVYSNEYRIVLPSGELRYIHERANVIQDPRSGQPIKIVGTAHDITERKQAEQIQAQLAAQLRQAQKMESIGHLAGGIAHDFNNMLAAIIGFIDSAQAQLPQQHPAQRDLEIAEASAWRAAQLTRQLLVFAHKQVVEPHVLSLNDVVVELDKLLRRLIGADIELVTLPAADLGQIRADPAQIEQVITNLVVNARDAMPDGGRLTIETANSALDDTYARQHSGVTPGEYVMLGVSDTGTGMDATVQQHIFEPFYTTKQVGKGSGLGLATCYSIVKQHGGNIWVYSEVGHGTTFKVYLPRVYAAADNLAEPAAELQIPRGSETVVLVEDEPLVREIARRILHAQGYTVLEAGNGDDAVRIIQAYARTPIALLITDVVMPQMGGKALAEQVTSAYPSIKVLFMSGYATDAIIHHGRLEPGTHFLSKPFTPAAFARKVREVLDGDA